MFLSLKFLKKIKDDPKLLAEYVRLFNDAEDTVDNLDGFYKEYFDSYGREGEYDQDILDEATNEYLAATDKLGEFERKNGGDK